MTQCTATVPTGEQCPWEVLPGETLCHDHRRAELHERRARIEARQRELSAKLYLPPTEYEARNRAWIAQQREARRNAWHARRRAEDAERKERAAAAREAAQEAATGQECRVCGRVLPLDAFARDKTGPLGRKTRCRDCQAVHDRERKRDR